MSKTRGSSRAKQFAKCFLFFSVRGSPDFFGSRSPVRFVYPKFFGSRFVGSFREIVREP